jgi:prevent-host-death family protein
MSPASRRKTPASRTQPAAKPNQWKLEDAKARFSEVVRQAAASGPQLVTVRGKEAAVILAPDEYRQLLPKPKSHRPLVSFLQSLGLDGIHLERERDLGREIEL